MKDIKDRVYAVLQITPDNNASRVFNIFLFSLIFLNVLAVILGTIEAVSDRWESFLFGFEIFSVVIFTIEYILRIWSATSDPKYSHPVKGRLKFALTPLMIIDLLAVFPFYISGLVRLDLRSLRALRLFRVLRLLRFRRYTRALRMMSGVLVDKKEELGIAALLILLLIIIFSSMIFFAEHDAQPVHFASIPDSMWWTVVTMTTVGYGDIIPVTGAGKVLGSFVSIMGIMMFALPTAIFVSGLIQAFEREKLGGGICPTCGQEIHRPRSNPPG